MSHSCPISYKRVDERVLKIVSIVIALTSVLYLITLFEFFIYLLLLDFSLRLFNLHKFSPFLKLSKLVAKVLKIEPKFSDGAAKRFALCLGWNMSVLMVVFSIFNLTSLVFMLVSFLALFATLEGLLGICVGCKIYKWLPVKIKSLL